VTTGDVIIVRYANDLVVGFEHRRDAERFLKEFQERLAKFGLEIQAEKTRLIEFGRFAVSNRKKRGEGKPETFTFLGFTHFCGVNSKRRFIVRRRTAAKRRRVKLQAIKQELNRKMHEPVAQAGKWLKQVVTGYYQYHAVPGNQQMLGRFRERICRYWRHVLRRRSQKRKPDWDRLRPIFEVWIPRSTDSASLSWRSL
jgi:RNA-directed DNA polymerase